MELPRSLVTKAKDSRGLEGEGVMKEEEEDLRANFLDLLPPLKFLTIFFLFCIVIVMFCKKEIKKESIFQRETSEKTSEKTS